MVLRDKLLGILLRSVRCVGQTCTQSSTLRIPASLHLRQYQEEMRALANESIRTQPSGKLPWTLQGDSKITIVVSQLRRRAVAGFGVMSLLSARY